MVWPRLEFNFGAFVLVLYRNRQFLSCIFNTLTLLDSKCHRVWKNLLHSPHTHTMMRMEKKKNELNGLNKLWWKPKIKNHGLLLVLYILSVCVGVFFFILFEILFSHVIFIYSHETVFMPFWIIPFALNVFFFSSFPHSFLLFFYHLFPTMNLLLPICPCSLWVWLCVCVWFFFAMKTCSFPKYSPVAFTYSFCFC